MSSKQEPQKRFHHIGLARDTSHSRTRIMSRRRKCWVTNPAHDPNRIEWLRYAPDSPIDPEFMNSPHIAYAVDELEPHLEGKEIYLRAVRRRRPAIRRVAFTREDGVFVEYMKIRPGRTWFNE